MSERRTDREQRLAGFLLPMLLLTLGFVLLLIGTVPEAINEIMNTRGPLPLLRAILTSLPVAFVATLIVAKRAALTILAQFLQAMYHLEPDEASKLLGRIIFGVPIEPPLEPLLRVQEGRPDPEGPEILHDVGGPGYLTVGHDNAVILARGGLFTRVEGARQVRLEAFEKIWDTVDLRPQRRELRVTANTRDGIPVTCRAEVRFRALRGDAEPIPQLTAPPLDFTDADRAIALRLATDKVALAPGGERAVTDWMIFLTNGTFDGEVRNRIERYRLDELFDPNRSGPALLTLIEEELTEAMSQIGKDRGVQIDQVHLLSLTPDEELIPEQWMALWRSQWERTAAKDEAAARAAHESEIEKAKARARAEMIAAMVQPLADLTDADLDTLLMGVQLEFLEVMRGMAQMDPLVQSVMFQQVENLERLIRELLQLPGASSPGGALPPAGSAPPPTGNTP